MHQTAEDYGKHRAEYSHDYDLERCIQRPIDDETDPPIWRIAPSRPAEPPKRCVMSVAAKTRGAVLRGRAEFSRTAASTKFVPRSFSIPQMR